MPGAAARERAVVITGSLTLVFTAWGLGCVQLWALHTLLFGSACTFALSIIPLTRNWNGTDGQHGNVQNFKRLLEFPVFWLGLLFLIYIGIQGMNPSWVQVKGENGWWVEELSAVSWLPSGVRADYQSMNAFRVMASFSAAHLLVCGLWIGLRRRKSVLRVLWIFSISGFLMAVLAILQKFTGADAVYWRIPSPNPSFWGTFFYRNEATIYLTLVITATATLYFYYFKQVERRGRSSGPHLLVFFFVVVIYTSIALALSRGGILFGGVVTAAFLSTVIFSLLYSPTIMKSVPLILITIILLGSCGYVAFNEIDVDAIKKRFGDVEETILNADKDSRVITTKVTWEMAQEKLWYGWGAGSWRYIFPMYQKSYPEIYYQRYDQKRGWLGRRVYHYAHNDVVQFLCEYGIIGCSLLLLIFAYWIGCLLFRASEQPLGAFMLMVGMIMALCHAFVDFVFQNPANWLVLNAVICLCIKIFMLDTKRRKLSKRMEWGVRY